MAEAALCKSLKTYQPIRNTLFLNFRIHRRIDSSKQYGQEMLHRFDGTRIDVNLKDAVGRTPLRIAAEKGDIDVAMFLIEAGQM